MFLHIHTFNVFVNKFLELAISSQNKTKIIFPFSTKGFGGSNISASVIIDGLQDDCVYEPVLTLPKEQFLKKYAYHVGSDVNVCFLKSKALSVGGGFLSLAMQMPSIAKQIVAAFLLLYKTKEARLVHVQDSVTFLIWWLPSFLLGRKLLWHIRCITKNNIFYKIAFRLADGLLFVSSLDKNFDRVRGKRESGEVIEFSPNLKKRDKNTLQNRTTKKVIKLIQVGCVGNRKRLFFTLKFFKHLIDHNINVSLTLVGLTDVEISMIKSNYSAIMHLIEMKTWVEDVQSFMHKSDVLILPSHEEAFGRVQLEAINCNLSILAAKSQASETLLGVNKRLGAIVNNDNVDEWTKMLLLISGQRSKAKSKNAAKKLFIDRYLFENNIERLKAFYSAFNSNA